MGILMDHFKNLSFLIRCMNLHLVKMIALIKKINKKNHVSFMPHVFSQNERASSPCGHFTQFEPFENL
jgi:hypothetical protein